ncbi:hypothetical protein GCM10017668_10760 [Streptomyces tuirus]|uniref:Uncharacterized protein n=1 Tax=Streptomyces tuirus TaxID=68278 RepID=A0A7G1N856_9ACTN|nr:hypothetical protein GCM10017668_10760 [Streptomyces tuirus]
MDLRGCAKEFLLGSDPATGTRAWRSRPGIVRQDESALAELTFMETGRHFPRCHPRPRDGKIWPVLFINGLGLHSRVGCGGRGRSRPGR